MILLCWEYLAPSQSRKEFDECIESMFGLCKASDNMKTSLQRAYQLAGQRKNEEHRVQMLSTFILQKDMTRDRLILMMGEEISSRKYHHAQHHAMIYGAGQPAELISHKRNVARRQIVVDNFVAYCLAKGVMTANGRTILVPGKESISVPNVKRLEGKQPLIKSFEDDERRIRAVTQGEGRRQKREYLSLRRSDMEDVIAVVCPEIHTSQAALDVVGQLHGTNNFKIIKTKLVQLEAMMPHFTDEILKVRAAVLLAEDVLSNKEKFRSKGHFGCEVDHHGPAVHCHYYAFGKVDPAVTVPVVNRVRMECGHYHAGSCVVCGNIENLVALLSVF